MSLLVCLAAALLVAAGEVVDSVVAVGSVVGAAVGAAALVLDKVG